MKKTMIKRAKALVLCIVMILGSMSPVMSSYAAEAPAQSRQAETDTVKESAIPAATELDSGKGETAPTGATEPQSAKGDTAPTGATELEGDKSGDPLPDAPEKQMKAQKSPQKKQMEQKKL